MKSIEEIADKYIREQYIDYGDLNDQAEIQIRDAVIFGLKQGQKLPIQNASNLLPCPFCGGEVEDEVVQWNISQAKCTECDETWGTCGSKYEGRFNKWNVRAPKSK